jgi:hypothetical protein
MSKGDEQNLLTDSQVAKDFISCCRDLLLSNVAVLLSWEPLKSVGELWQLVTLIL